MKYAKSQITRLEVCVFEIDVNFSARYFTFQYGFLKSRKERNKEKKEEK
jgi:hypothetical protein